ncbi:Guanylate kinase [Waddlia chondrophila 2032/99]|uniref:Guanylate kinase n=2 Tax=Waddlia chondrophila TaxID=71667 RepID=D6YVB2_WADCW|nr:guanylate kinase [Waddlia chondrophila]ADI38073.1 Guanylate kinase [Waddlia chondrophila WSU 86-1044]CCB91227.1 Guanylate kinase [Waddlia chondrophila 2032/99]
MSSKLLGNREKGLVFIVSAPAGTGKTTLTQMLVDEFPCVVESISYTTREKREEEVDGVHYRFITREKFEEKIQAGEFLEYADIYGDLYGTSKKWVESRLEKGLHVVLVIDTQGALKLKSRYPATYIFISPPSFEELRRRLLERRTESDEVIAKRLAWAKKEVEKKNEYDYWLVNNDLETAYQVLRSIVIAEEYKIKKVKKGV